MTSETQTIPQGAPAGPALPPWLKTVYWSVRRELWEHRSIWIAPAAVAAIAVFGYVLGTLGLPRLLHAAVTPATADKLAEKIALPYAFVAFATIMTGGAVAVFYSLGALHNERRDRSLLFWKSLPVSDLTTVLAKAAVPTVVLPAVLVAVSCAAHILMLAWSTLVAVISGADPQLLWAHVPIPTFWRMLADGVPFMALWYLPLNAWLIMVSAWARRVPYLWATLPPLALALVEHLALGTHHIFAWLALRLAGPFYGMGPSHHAQPTPPGWTSPEFWIGLVLAAAFLAVAVRLRRYSDPI
jgi:ABC-2 type transport system permease protein